MDRERTIKNAEAAFRDSNYGMYGLSVFSVAGLSATEIVELARSYTDDRYLRYKQMRTSTVGRLRARGFGLLPDSPLGHYLLTIPAPPTDEDWDALQEEFGLPEPTPPIREV